MKMLVRCAGSSLAAVALEFVILSLLVSLGHVNYLLGSVIASVAGLVVCFFANRQWAFEASTGAIVPQLVRHGFVVGGGLLLGLFLMWLQVHSLGLPYQFSWLAAGSVVFFAWTFPMQRWFTFRATLAPVRI